MVAFNELENSPTFNLTLEEGIRATRRGDIAWSDMDAFINEVFPPNEFSGARDVGVALPTNDTVRAVSLDIVPWPSNKITGPDTEQDFDTLADYDRARCTIEYKSLDSQEQDPQEFLSHRWSASGEFLTLPTPALTWSDGTRAAEGVNAGFVIPRIEQQITWSRILSPPFTAIRSRIGTCNSGSIDFGTGTAASETLLFTGADLRRQIMTNGVRAWSLTYKFSEKRVSAEDQSGPGGWNHFFRNEKSKAGFYRLKISASGGDADVYQKTSFAELFQQEA